MILGEERFGLTVKALARELGKTPDGISQAIARAARKRAGDDAFRRDLNELDQALAGAESEDEHQQRNSVTNTFPRGPYSCQERGGNCPPLPPIAGSTTISACPHATSVEAHYWRLTGDYQNG